MYRPLFRAAAAACLAVSPLVCQGEHPNPQILLRYAHFDPAVSSPEVAVPLRSNRSQRLHIVQFHLVPTEADRQAIAGRGGQVIGYLPENAYVVRIDDPEAQALASLASVRWVGDYHPAFRLEPELRQAKVWVDDAPVRYNLVVADKHRDKPILAANIQAIGGVVDDDHFGSLLFTATLTGPQLLQVAAMDEVLWIDRWTPTGEDMNNARIQGGGNYVEAQGGFTGTGVNAHIYEGVEAGHQDFTGTVTNVRSGGAASSHGHCTAGIVFGNGTSNPAVRGMAPDAGKFYTNNGSVIGSRWQVVSDLVNIYNVSHTTASWGNSQTTAYTSVSADADDITFDHDIAWTQSQSNTGNQNSRPQAWGKNIFSIGGVRHNNNSNPADDSWAAGGASTGPAADGRIKPTLCAYYDAIGTSDRSGSAGYSSGNWYASFGGTSGATPIVAGHNVLAIQMFTTEVVPGYGLFGQQLRVPGGSAHQNRPHFPTLKALQVANAAQYAFTASSSDNRRHHQGWGFPDLQAMYDNRFKTYIVDETDVVTQGAVRQHGITVAAGQPYLKAVLNWNEPAGNPAASQQLINNLSLRVTSPSGTVYWGNNGLNSGVWSTPGGSEDTINSIECVFVQNPQAGTWVVEVLATAIVQDNHVETPAVDADYGLVVVGGTGQTGTFAQFTTFGQGCDSSVVIPMPPCAEWNPGGGTLSGLTPTTEWLYRVGSAVPLSVQSFEIFTRSTSGQPQTVQAYIYDGTPPGIAPTAVTTMTVGTTPGFYTATFATPVSTTNVFQIGIDMSSGTIERSELLGALANVGYERTTPNGAWSVRVIRPGYRVNCAPIYQVPAMGNSGTPQLGSTYNLLLSDAPPSVPCVLVSGLSDTIYQGIPLPVTLPGTNGCDLLVAPTALDATLTSGAGTASRPMVVPNNASLTGLEVFHQWLVNDGAANGLGLITSDAGKGTVGL